MTKVVPFERPAAYWRAHARRHDTPDKRPAAAKMLRKALEKTGDPATAMELARVFTTMECPTAAERCLLRAVARGGLTGQACYLMGCCALNRGEEALAEEAFDACQRLDPGSPWADQAQDTLEMYPWTWENEKKGTHRAAYRCRMAREALLNGRTEEALALARRSWKQAHTPQGALLMGALREAEDAIPFFAYAARELPGALRPRLLLAMACHHAGKTQDALLHLHLARALCRTLNQTEDFCAAAWQMEMPREALEAVNEFLAEWPSSVDYLRLKYLCFKRMGQDADARRTLETLLDIDPDDAGGLWYRRHPEDCRLPEGRSVLLHVLGHQLRAVPERLRPGPLNRLLHWLVMALREDVDAEEIYRLAVPVWRCMSRSERWACDEGKYHYPAAVALLVLLRSGKAQRAQALFESLPGKKRLKRTLNRWTRRMNKE